MRRLLFAASILSFTLSSSAQVPKTGDAVPHWEKGYLDLHHINTGRGSVAYYIFPDGTTMLFDAGEEDPTEPRTLSARNSVIRPDNSKRPYEWIVNYIQQVAPRGKKAVINYGILTHFHDDHMGAWYEGAPRSAKGNYVLTGITGVAELLPVENWYDRGYPSYNIPFDMKGKEYEDALKKITGGERYWKTMQNYLAFIAQRDKEKMLTASLKAGSRTQIRLKFDSASFGNFYVRNVKSNERIWTGTDTSTFNQFPQMKAGEKNTFPSENALSQGILINYGDFKYYTGGDIPGNVQYGQEEWMDVETPVSKAVGKVDIATMDHHGNRDAVNENMVKNLQPRIWIEQSWSSDHPGQEVLIRTTSTYLYPGERDLFTTNMLQANKDVIGTAIDKSYKSQQGHVLVRVLPGAKQYFVIILDDAKAVLKVKAVFGPYDVVKK